MRSASTTRALRRPRRSLHAAPLLRPRRGRRRRQATSPSPACPHLISAARSRSTPTVSSPAKASAPMSRCRRSARRRLRRSRKGSPEPAFRYSIRRAAAGPAERRGGPRGARPGTLSTMVSGAPATFESVKPLLETVARNVFYMGEEPGLGQVTKLANNMISAAGMAAAFETSAMAVKAGVDARTLIETVNASTGRNSATMDKFPAAILTRSFDYSGKLSTMYKDVFLCLEEARELDVPTWVGSNVVQLWFHAMTQGRGNDDYTALIQMIEDWAGVVVGGNESGPIDRKPK